MNDAPPPEARLAEGERNGRRYTVEVRPSMAEGQYQGLMLRCWGQGHWMIGTGAPTFVSTRVHAVELGERWLDTGKN